MKAIDATLLTQALDDAALYAVRRQLGDLRQCAEALGVRSVTAALKAPFPYMGGKSRIAREVWRRFGDVPNLRRAVLRLRRNPARPPAV
jgi:hypothetical protein